MSGNIRYPNITAADYPGKIIQMQSYLHQLVEQLNFTLSALEKSTNSFKATGTGTATGEQTEIEKKLLDSVNNLKSLIIKSANTVRQEMDQLETELGSTYVAASDFGTFREDIHAQITATAASIEQALSYYAELIALVDEASAEFDSYVIETEGYIRQGIIGYENAVPVIGIAIGQNIRVTGSTEVVNGQSYDVIDTSSNMSVWTPDKLAFYINGAEAGYFSNGALYTGDTIVTGKLFMANNKWEISHGSGLTIKWIGG